MAGEGPKETILLGIGGSKAATSSGGNDAGISGSCSRVGGL